MNTKSIAVLAVFLIISLSKYAVEALTCYTCDSYSNENCGKTFVSTGISAVTAPVSSNTKCYKFIAESGSDAYIIRGANAPSTNLNTLCLNKQSYSYNGYEGTLYCCSNDNNCNSSRNIKANILLSILSCAIAFFLFKFK